MTLDEAKAFIASVPWRQVREDRGPIDSHEYVINGWPEVDADDYWDFVRLIKRDGERGRYAPPYDPTRWMENSYLEIDKHVFWAIPPKQICRTLIEHRQHEPLGEQLELTDNERRSEDD